LISLGFPEFILYHLRNLRAATTGDENTPVFREGPSPIVCFSINAEGLDNHGPIVEVDHRHHVLCPWTDQQGNPGRAPPTRLGQAVQLGDEQTEDHGDEKG
jgi:hypothetical protein